MGAGFPGQGDSALRQALGTTDYADFTDEVLGWNGMGFFDIPLLLRSEVGFNLKSEVRS